MRLFRALFASKKWGKPPVIDAHTHVQRWKLTATDYWQIIKDKGWWWLLAGVVPAYRYCEYNSDVRMASMVRYNVKLYPEKPKPQLLPF